VRVTPNMPSSENSPSWQPLLAAPAAPTPIQHVVVLYQENHSFDNVFGHFCVAKPARDCDGVVTGKLHDGSTISLPPSLDRVAVVKHDYRAQIIAMNGGTMDGFDL